MIDKINDKFVAVEINITDVGFPSDVPALEPWRKSYEKEWRHQFGFATSVVIMPEGSGALGTSGCGHTWEWNTSINYDAARFTKYLDGCLDRFQRARKLFDAKEMDPKERAAEGKKLREEVIKQLSDANKCKKP
ncbi:MAG TPA: hypothetical protein VI643_03785 [Planctomycetota bacterium]|nr:hypothetical protein [Planctomycetota bacterium]